ncbi:RusA family crossover junction endodeoxyribonuclease [Gordonia sp. (in: high G+C Gram-positive bacteria)]|uniref:RusA family crossover junction endodeoxyribonuclease n=1 Tax=Gordonia sp. (in: high G+C Gram-positive bacteria) TaxID=84139 RepID=UPI003F959899
MIPFSFTVPVARPVMTSNDQRAWTWPKVRQAKQAMALQVRGAARAAQIAPQTEQVAIRVTWYPKDRIRRDSDSLGPFVKAALDALVTMHILADDNRDHVASVTTAIGQPDKTNPRIVITIVPAQACWVCGDTKPPPESCGLECQPERTAR